MALLRQVSPCSIIGFSFPISYITVFADRQEKIILDQFVLVLPFPFFGHRRSAEKIRPRMKCRHKLFPLAAKLSSRPADAAVPHANGIGRIFDPLSHSQASSGAFFTLGLLLSA